MHRIEDTYSLSHFRQHTGEHLERIRAGRVETITQNGEAAVVAMSPEHYDLLIHSAERSLARDGAIEPTLPQALELFAHSIPGVLTSRRHAVDRIYSGGLLTLMGSVAMLGLLVHDQWSPPFSLLFAACLSVTGTGLTLIGIAARHLQRFGGLIGSLFLTAAGGFGISVLLLGAGDWLGAFVAPGLDVLTTWGEMGIWFFAGTLALLVVGVLLRSAVESVGGDES